MDRRVHDVVEWLTRHPARRLDVHVAAASAELSADQFSRLFRRETGQSFRAYQIAVRIDRARELLAESSMTVSQVSRVLGYADHRLFARQFKDHTGTAPASGGAPRERTPDRSSAPQSTTRALPGRLRPGLPSAHDLHRSGRLVSRRPPRSAAGLDQRDRGRGDRRLPQSRLPGRAQPPHRP
ncbi:helix-turn-helix domain-containing protein [Streptomyces sp. CY1]|uniref:helix-turn-helix domain-containing protein n=1 Tax=Streptomyces sp. CY1 TaxID=3388313 RepID=UPI0039A38A73